MLHLGSKLMLPLDMTPEVKYPGAPILSHKFGQKFICNAEIHARYHLRGTNKHGIGLSITPVG